MKKSLLLTLFVSVTILAATQSQATTATAAEETADFAERILSAEQDPETEGTNFMTFLDAKVAKGELSKEDRTEVLTEVLEKHSQVTISEDEALGALSKENKLEALSKLFQDKGLSKKTADLIAEASLIQAQL